MTLAARIEVSLGTLALGLDLDVAAGEVVALLGPNGAGKTTVLRAVAGLQPLDGGTIAIDGTVVDAPMTDTFLPPERRAVGMVFQDYLLFPHLDALDNVAFGLRSRGASNGEARSVARQWLDRVGIGDLAGARPAALSGGQAQRAALARALAAEPRVLLLDEPLAALDVGTRATVRRDLRRHLSDFDGATVLVTHDALDALALADRVVIVEAGSVAQAGTIDEVTTRPRSPYVADLIGVNLLRGAAHGTAVDLDHGGRVIVADSIQGPVLLLIRPHSIALHRHRPESSARNQWQGEILGFDLLGDRVRVQLGGPVPLVAEVTPAAVADLGLVEGTTVWATIKATDITTYPA
ncbi:MAG TPA: ABC transporter ATP-binding protein [Acidimicrobiales bacterium]